MEHFGVVGRGSDDGSVPVVLLAASCDHTSSHSVASDVQFELLDVAAIGTLDLDLRLSLTASVAILRPCSACLVAVFVGLRFELPVT